MSSSRVVVPDEGNSSRGVAEAGLEESAAHNLVRDHQGCQGLTEHRISSNDVSDSRNTDRLVDGERKTANDCLTRGRGTRKLRHTPRCTSWSMPRP